MIKEMISEGDLDSQLPDSAKKMNPVEKLKKAIEASNVLLLIQGGAENPENNDGKEMLQISKSNFKDYVVLDSL